MARYRDSERVNTSSRTGYETGTPLNFSACGSNRSPDFKSIGFDAFRNQAGLNSFALAPKLRIGKTAAEW